MRTTSQILLWWCIVNSVWNHCDLSCIMMSSSITPIQHDPSLNNCSVVTLKCICKNHNPQILLWWSIVNSVWNHCDLTCIMMSSSTTSIQHNSSLNTLFSSDTLMHACGPQVRQNLLWWCIVNSVWNHYDLSCIMSNSITSIQHWLLPKYIVQQLHPNAFMRTATLRSCCDDVLWILSEIIVISVIEQWAAALHSYNMTPP